MTVPAASRRRRSLLWSAFRSVALAYLIVLLMLSILERWLVFPAPSTAGVDWQPAGLEFEDVYFTGSDGVRLHGWFVPHENPRAIVLYCHGNAEDVPRLADRLKILHDRIGVAVFAWDYRGYGRSEGTSHETNVIDDARQAMAWLTERTGTTSRSVVVMGRSLGGAVAIAVAAEMPIRGLVLDRTFASLTDTAAIHFPWIPVRWLMKNRFGSAERIATYKGPLLQTHGTDDEVIPFAMAEELFAASQSAEKRFLRVEGGNHNGPLPESCYEALNEFLAKLPE